MLEMKITMAKMHFLYDMELRNPSMDWQGESEMHLLWKKPPLMARITRRG